jgi:hypothetical protein
MESNMKAAAQGLAGNKEDFYGASSSSKSPVGGISQETKDALFGNSPWFSFRPPNANENEPLGKKISNSPKGAPKSKEEESQHLKDIGVNIQTESSGKVHQNEAVDKSSSSSPPTKDKAVQEGSSSANTPVKEQEDQASKESLSSSSTPAKAKEDQAVEEGSSSSNTHVKGQKDEVAEKSSSSSPPVTKQEGQADQENSSLGSTPIKEQEDSAAKQTRPSGESNDAEEDSRSSELYLDENDDEVEDSRSSAPSLDESNEEEDSRASKAYLEEIDDEEDNSRSPESSLDQSNEDEDSRSSEAYSEEIDEEEEDSRSSEAYSEEAENQEDDSRSSEAYSEESNGDEDDSRSSEAYSEAISEEEEDSSSSEPSLEDAPPTENVNPTDPVLSSANAPSTPGKSNFKPIKLLLKRAVKFVTDKKNGVTYKVAKVYLPDFPEAITSQPHFIGAKYRGNPIRRKYQFSRQNKDGSFLYWRPKKWNHRERHIVVYPFEEGVQARSIFQTRDEGFDVPAWSNSTDTSYPVVDDYEEDFRDDEDDIIEDIEYYPEDLASLYDTPNSKSSPNLETSNTNTITTPILPRSVANPASVKEGSDTISPIGQRDARSSGADQLFDIWDDENKIEIKGLHDKHALEYINAPIVKASLNPKPGYTSKAESKAGAEKEKLKEKEESSEKTDIFFSEKTGTFNSAPKRTIEIWGY